MIISNNQHVQIASIRFFAKEFFVLQNLVLLSIAIICLLTLIFIDEYCFSYKLIAQGTCLSLISSAVFFFIVNEFPRIVKKKKAIVTFSRKINTNLNDIYSLKFFLSKEIESILNHVSKNELGRYLKSINISDEYFSNFDKKEVQDFLALIKPEYVSLGHVVTKNPRAVSRLKMKSFSNKYLDLREVMRWIIKNYMEQINRLVKDDTLALQLHLITPDLYDRSLDMKEAMDRAYSYKENTLTINNKNYNDMSMKGMFFDVFKLNLVKTKEILSDKYFIQFPEPDRQAYENALQ